MQAQASKVSARSSTLLSTLLFYALLSLFCLLSYTSEDSTKVPTCFSTFQSQQSPTHPYSSCFYNTCRATEAMTMLDQDSSHPGPQQTVIHSPGVLYDNTTPQSTKENLINAGTQDCVSVLVCLWVSVYVCLSFSDLSVLPVLSVHYSSIRHIKEAVSRFF